MNIEWLKRNALFRCDRCEDQCHQAADLRIYQGKTCCENCYSDIDLADNAPGWFGLPVFDPFAAGEKTDSFIWS